ncbi:MAG: hypothetical protein NVSMB29_02410 [Candidatus Dormibacteria bacterium]
MRPTRNVRTTRRLAVALVSGAAALAITGITVFACAVLTTTHLSQVSGPAGSTVTLTGSNFGVAHGDVTQNFTPVQIRLDTPTGPLLATTTPATDGSLNVPVTIPGNAAPGYHVLLVSQQNAQGAPVPGSPGRVLFQVGSSQAGTVAAANPNLQNVAATPATSDTGLGLAAVLAIATGGLLLAGVGGAVGIREVTARRRPTVA